MNPFTFGQARLFKTRPRNSKQTRKPYRPITGDLTTGHKNKPIQTLRTIESKGRLSDST